MTDHAQLRSVRGSVVLVTGAAGGLGSLAVAMLSRLGYRVAASTGRAETHDYLKGLGAKTLVARAERHHSIRQVVR